MRGYTPAILVGTVTALVGGFAGAANTGFWAVTGGSHASMMITAMVALAAPITVGAAIGFAFGFGVTLLVMQSSRSGR